MPDDICRRAAEKQNGDNKMFAINMSPSGVRAAWIGFKRMVGPFLEVLGLRWKEWQALKQGVNEVC
jgi:hypothetical protein